MASVKKGQRGSSHIVIILYAFPFGCHRDWSFVGLVPFGLPKLGSVVVSSAVPPLPLEVGGHDLELQEVLADFGDVREIRGLDALFEESATISLDSSDDLFVNVGALLTVGHGGDGVRQTQVVPGQQTLAVVPPLKTEDPVTSGDGDGGLRIQ